MTTAVELLDNVNDIVYALGDGDSPGNETWKSGPNLQINFGPYHLAVRSVCQIGRAHV